MVLVGQSLPSEPSREVFAKINLYLLNNLLIAMVIWIKVVGAATPSMHLSTLLILKSRSSQRMISPTQAKRAWSILNVIRLLLMAMPRLLIVITWLTLISQKTLIIGQTSTQPCNILDQYPLESIVISSSTIKAE